METKVGGKMENFGKAKRTRTLKESMERRGDGEKHETDAKRRRRGEEREGNGQKE